jgi:hypothetical protein
LYFDINKEGVKSNGSILNLEISKGNFILKNVFHLFNDKKVGWYDSFCVSDDKSKIYAFEGVSYEIQIFDVN